MNPTQSGELKVGTEAAREHMASTVISETEKMVVNKEKLVDRLTDARKALEMASGTYKKTWFEWVDESKNILPELRTWRMAVDSELAMVLKHFGEVRQFFLSDKHDEEVKRLREFVGLMERLKALKDSGFLDRVADTMLKLEIK